MRDRAAASLFSRHPRRVDVPLLILVSAGLLAAGYLLPFMEIKKLVFLRDDYTLLQSIQAMWTEHQYVLAVIILVFSIVFPIAKLVALAFLWVVPGSDEQRAQWLHWLGIMGKWSMLDVFVVALIIVMTRSASMLEATPQIGVYLFAAAVVLSMVVTILVERIARESAS